MKVFHHNDMDGRCAGAVVAFNEKNYDRENFFDVNYINDLPLDKVAEGEKVYLVDYSFTEATVWQLKKLVEELKCEVIWIDHHDSSISLETDNQWLSENLSKIKGTRSKDFCGAVLTWLYFNSETDKNIPHFLRYVDDYDCWKNNLQPETTYFKLFIDTQKCWATGDIWKDFLNEEVDLQTILEQGKTVKAYVDEDLLRARKSLAYESKIRTSKTESLPCIVINRRMNSSIFGELINEYPVAITWTFNGRRFLYTLYSADPKIDCSKIAENYGGGGHKGAAGFSSTKLLFKEGGMTK